MWSYCKGPLALNFKNGLTNLKSPSHFFYVGPQSFFWGEIFPRKGQDICFLGAKLLESNYNVLVRKIFFPKLSKGGGLLLFENNFEIGAPKKFSPGPRQALGGPDQKQCYLV